MKKILILVMILMFTVSLSAQTVENLTGFDWRTWTLDGKVGYVRGFMSAYSTVMEMIIYETGPDISKEKLQEVENRFYIPLTLGQVIERLDNIYESYDNRSIPLYDVFMVIIGKDYWNGD